MIEIRPRRVSIELPTGICASAVSVTKLLLPGRLILTLPDTGLTLTVLPATGGGRPGDAGAGFRSAVKVSAAALVYDDAARSGRESLSKSAAATC